MRVTVKTEEGKSDFPLPAKPVVVDTEGLAPHMADRLRALVSASGFFHLPTAIGVQMRSAAGARKHTIFVEDGPRAHRVSTLESKARAPLRDLVDFVVTYGTRVSGGVE
ncbi:hypothetical protein LVJ94_32590 [Pendulispora rubella]|uniref:Uncharacterized protein n=1 Tax=Pendulispora rubella TaxID=2741070 RepID=A0ABZ2KSK4_9BACT